MIAAEDAALRKTCPNLPMKSRRFILTLAGATIVPRHRRRSFAQSGVAFTRPRRNATVNAAKETSGWIDAG